MTLWLEIFGAIAGVGLWVGVCALLLVEVESYLAQVAGAVLLCAGFTTEVTLLIKYLR